MGGYIALTTQDWILSLKAMNAEAAVFWRKKKSFKAVQVGEPIYFLRRGSFSSNSERYIVGKGLFCKHELLSANEAWIKYNTQLGFSCEQDFNEAVFKIYKEQNPELGCLRISKVQFYETSISLMDAKIDFSPYIVSGKKISIEECNRIDSLEMEVQSGTKKTD